MSINFLYFSTIKYISTYICGYCMTNKSSEATRYMIQVGTNRFRRDTWEAMKDICAIEGTRLADEIWAALDMHVKQYSDEQKLNGDGRVMMDKPPANVFDDVVDKVVKEAQEEVLEEVADAKGAEEDGSADDGRMASSNMFGSYKPSKEARRW